MKTIKIIGLPLAFLLLIGNVFAQDDFYPSSKKKNKEVVIAPVDEKVSDDEYSTATDYYTNSIEQEAQDIYNERMGITDSTTYYEDEDGNLRVTNNYYSGDNYDYSNEYYDYEYSSRIRRFHRPYARYSYYDDCYTNYYWYDNNPFNYGVSLYTSYGWWNPRPWNWNFGWSWNSGWYGGYSWGWGFNNFGYYGNSYWNGYNHGFNNGYYANNYYNSYDRNSHYYGHRGGSSGYSGYGKGSRPSGSSIVSPSTSNKPSIGKGRTFGEKYEAAVKSNNLNTNSVRPRTGVVNNGTQVKPRTTNSNTYSQPRTAGSPKVIPRTSTNTNSGNNGYNKPRTIPNTTPRPRTNDNLNYNKPRINTGSPSGYNKPRTINNGGNSQPRNNGASKPRTYTKPATKPTYNKPKTNTNYSRPSNSYSRPSGGNYNRGSSGGGSSSGRRPR
jgi:hypothetical protein